MTLLVKNEADIIEYNIKNHISQGVDVILVLDDNSTDETPVILNNLAKKGLIYLIDYPTTKYDHNGLVNYLGIIATEDYKVDLLFHCDADELWISSAGNLKQEMLDHWRVTGLYVPFINVMLKDCNGREKFPDDLIYHVIRPIKNRNSPDRTMNDFLLRDYPEKVLYKVIDRYYNVEHGNHEIVSNDKYKIIMGKSKYITIYHFPIRGKQQFYDKINKAKDDLEKRNHVDINTSWHWQYWIKELESGNFDNLYKSLILSEFKANRLIERKIVEKKSLKDINSRIID